MLYSIAIRNICISRRGRQRTAVKKSQNNVIGERLGVPYDFETLPGCRIGTQNLGRIGFQRKDFRTRNAAHAGDLAATLSMRMNETSASLQRNYSAEVGVANSDTERDFTWRTTISRPAILEKSSSRAMNFPDWPDLGGA